MSNHPLPPALEPWRAWLSLFAPDLQLALNDFLLRLAPALGRFRVSSLQSSSSPQGIGAIVRRGKYERLLLSEWAYADVLPEEFIRRAANQELLFLGPEPERSQKAWRCIALFDCGPWQLGEPRLLHIALLILLARRAQEAGAQFEFGFLQQPGQLFDETSRTGLQTLLQARSAQVVKASDIAAWQSQLRELGTELSECWTIGGAQTLPLPLASQRVQIRTPLMPGQLEAILQMGHTQKKLTLTLPETKLAVRLLRDPFQPLATPVSSVSKSVSMKQAPIFSSNGRWVLLRHLDDSAMIVHAQQGTKKIKTETITPTAKEHTIAAALIGKRLVTITLQDKQLRLHGFPQAPLFGKSVDLPMPDDFRPLAGLAQWQNLYVMQTPKHTCKLPLRIWLRDSYNNLACWEFMHDGTVKARPNVANVIGISRFSAGITFATSSKHGVSFFSWADANSLGPSHHFIIEGTYKQALICPQSGIQTEQTALFALKTNNSEWQIFEGSERTSVTLDVNEKAIALRHYLKMGKTRIGLLVLGQHSGKLFFISAEGRREMLHSPTPITQISLESNRDMLAWLCMNPRALHVRPMQAEKDMLKLNLEVASEAERTDTSQELLRTIKQIAQNAQAKANE